MKALVEESSPPRRITIVVPVYNEEAVLPDFFREVQGVTNLLEWGIEWIFVDDGSIDRTSELVRSFQPKQNDRITLISLSRNFGKESAILAGLEESSGQYVAVMDADLQDPPELLPEMLRVMESGDYEMVSCVRQDRSSQGKLRGTLSEIFYSVWNRLSAVPIKRGVRDYRMMKRPVVDAFIQLREVYRFFKGLFEWLGFRVTTLGYWDESRGLGKASGKYSDCLVTQLMEFCLFLRSPLRVASLLGALISLAAFIYMVWVVVKTLLLGDPVQGYPSLMTVLLFVSGAQLLCLGVLGEYVGRLYQESKKRPIDFVSSIERR